MKVRGDNAPPNAFTIEEQPKKPGYVLVRFFEHVAPFEETKDGLTISGYEYDEYRLELPSSADLFETILNRYDYFLSEAKRQDPGAVDDITQIQLALAELAETQADVQTANELALAELAELITGGV